MRANPTRSVFVLGALCFALTGSGPAARSQNVDEPHYTPAGDLVLPSGFETWVFVGSNLGLSYTPEAAQSTPWAYYNFTDPSDPAKVLASATAFPDQSCANCHQLHASIDNVWVQFYPALRDARR